MTIDDWYEHAQADAERRGLPGLRPLLEALADSARALRSVDWESLANREADGTAPPGQDPPGPITPPGGGVDQAEGARS